MEYQRAIIAGYLKIGIKSQLVTGWTSLLSIITDRFTRAQCTEVTLVPGVEDTSIPSSDARSLIPRGVIDCPPKAAFVCICIEAGFTTKLLLTAVVTQIWYSDLYWRGTRRYFFIPTVRPIYVRSIPIRYSHPNSTIWIVRYFVGEFQKGSTFAQL